MDTLLGAVDAIAERQHGVLATWQLRELGWSSREIQAALARERRVYRGVCSLGEELTHLGTVLAAVLAQGPGAALSHVSSLRMRDLRPWEPDVLHVSAPGRGTRTQREGIVVHRPRRPFAIEFVENIPVTAVSRALADADLEPHELFRALEEAQRRRLRVDVSPLPRDVIDLLALVQGRTRSDAEARFLMLCHDRGIALPLVNRHVNGIEADFQWPAARLILELDGWEFHKSREQFEEDRRRGLVHAAAGWHVIRTSARQVWSAPDLVASALRPFLAFSAPTPPRRARRTRTGAERRPLGAEDGGSVYQR